MTPKHFLNFDKFSKTNLVSIIERAIEIEPNDRNYFVLGEILFHFGKVDSACETYRKSIRAKSREDD